jgi:hypothetical protein
MTSHVGERNPDDAWLLRAPSYRMRLVRDIRLLSGLAEEE